MDRNIAEQAIAAVDLDRAVRMRARGAHWGEVADSCGYATPAAALRAVGTAMAAAVQRAEMTADQHRDEANLRLDMLLAAALDMLDADAPEAYDADGNPLVADDRAVRLRAVDEARRLVLDKARLNGADRPSAEGAGGALTVRVVGIDPGMIV